MDILRGTTHPFGHSFNGKIHNFSVFSDRNLPLTLVIYPAEIRSKPLCEIPMHKTKNIFHIAISSFHLPFTYTYRIDTQETFDPYAKELTSSATWGEASMPMRSLPTSDDVFDWEGVTRPEIPFSSLIIYEMHIRGFTKGGGDGTYEEAINKIPYLKSLGINAVEILPIHTFDETQIAFPFSPSGKALYNYWGYNSLSFFEPKRSYANKGESPTKAFKSLVKEFHRHGIEVLLDVVYNHVSTSSPLFLLAPSTYFLLGEEQEHTNYTGCGNTLHCNDLQTMDLIISSLRYYADEFHVDGFRFDLASIFCRTHHGRLLSHPPILEKIANDSVLSKLKMIAEPWDASGLYQIGSFPSPLFAEWNDHYRDSVRQFVKGDSGKKEAFIDAMIGSRSLYQGKKAPFQSINFISCHDGFTLMDLLSYNGKHNEENGEGNRDGTNWNHSWNCGAEGPTLDPSVLRLREKQFCNYMVCLFLSQGTPMFFMGDEIGATHLGNNNAYCQDVSWNYLPWQNGEKYQHLFSFVQKLIALRVHLPFLRFPDFIKEDELSIHNGSLLSNLEGSERFVAFQIFETLLYVFNANNFSLTIHLPLCQNGLQWKMLVYTTNPIETAIFSSASAPPIGDTIVLDPYTCLIAIQTLK